MERTGKRILLFAGTTEGRKIAEVCAAHQIPLLACVATEYGETLLPHAKGLEIRTGRMDEEEMAGLMERECFAMAVDATHPYADCVTKNIQSACRRAGLSYVRLLRGESSAPRPAESRVVYKRSGKEAAAYLSQREGTVFLTTGSKELEEFSSMEGFGQRVYARILPSPAMIQKAMELGLPGSRIIGMQGPFSKEMNEAMFRQAGASYLVTKESGAAGGFAEKMEAAFALGMTAVVIGRPTKETGKSLEETVDLLLSWQKDCGKAEENKKKRTVHLVGIGMGDAATLTAEAREVIEGADILIGAKRMVERPEWKKTQTITAYLPRDVRAAVEACGEKQAIAVLLSGDSGFFSGAQAMAAELRELEKQGYDLQILPGISSLSCLSARAGLAWQEVYPVSAHGRSCAPAGIVSRRKKTYFLLDQTQDLAWLCRRLAEYELSEVLVVAGRDLGAPEEVVLTGTPEEILRERKKQGEARLECAFVQNPAAREEGYVHPADEEFLREDAIPMTKGEIRALSMAKLNLQKDSVVYDIGAGTGGMTVEMAMAAWQGQVYAIEKKEEAAALIQKNCRRFHTDQVRVIHGSAPEAMAGLPAPTHALIGGSSGNLREIVSCLLEKNPHVRLVIHAITLETMGEAAKVMRQYAFSEEEAVEVSVARSRKAGPYHLMMGQNPILLITLQN